MISASKRRPRIVVVDPHPGDYEGLIRGQHQQRLEAIEFYFHQSGRSVLREEAEPAPELVVINMNLPDMSGLDLYDMVAQRWPGVPVFLVGDDYRPEDEVLARTSGATFYFCKPLQREWILAGASELC